MNKPLLLTLVCVALISCALMPASDPTATPRPANTLVPTGTTTPTPTHTVIATESFAVSDPDAFSTLVVVQRFTILVPFPLLHQLDKQIILIGNEEGTLSVSFTSDSFGEGDTLESVMDEYLGSLERRGWEFTRSEPVEVEIDGAFGIGVDLTVRAQNKTFEGQAVAVSPRADLILFGLGLYEVGADPEGWKNEGQKTFKVLMDSIDFVEAGNLCPISTDETYGYSEDNPIRVGGDFSSGVSRERAYLDHLRGPNGERLYYERQGSLPSGDTILDIYNVTGPGIDEILHIDLYNYSELKAPVGFTCEGPFPLSAP